MTAELKDLRKIKNITQKECAEYLGVPLRTYKNYENDETKRKSVKYQYMLEKLTRYGLIDEEHGVLSVDRIKTVCAEVFSDYSVEYCYLFGSYAKNTATEASDVDLLISTSVSGLAFFELVEKLRTALNKKTDVLNINQLNNNYDLVKEILRDGIRIYG